MVINFFGKRGSGKTTAIRGNLKYCRPPIVIVDILGNFNEPEYIQTKTIQECIIKIKEYYVSPGENNKIINLQTGEYDLAVDYISACLWEINGGTMILDEVDCVKFSEAPCFDQIIRYGRNHNVDIITGCRRPAELERNITAAANKFYCFGTHEFRDIEYFRSSVFNERADELQRVEKFSGLFMDYDQGIVGKYYIDIQGNVFHTEEASV